MYAYAKGLTHEDAAFSDCSKLQPMTCMPSVLLAVRAVITEVATLRSRLAQQMPAPQLQRLA